MFRGNNPSHLTAVLAFVIVGWLTGIAAADDQVAGFLERHGLKKLLAAHLEQQIEQMKPEDRGDTVLRLAALYAELLEADGDTQRRQEIEERSRRLLEKAPSNSADDLRLALIRASYRTAEKIAENHRLRMSSAAELDSARRTLDELIPQLTTLRARLKQAADAADRRLARSGPATAVHMTDGNERVQVLLAQCTFMNAWALYYQSYLSGTPASAALAEPMFAEMLLADTPFPEPHEVSTDLRANEAVARAILGLALCKSITSSAATANAWIRLLEHETTFEPLRMQAAGWRLAVYLEHREYQHVVDLLNQQKESETPVAWLRLIAVHAIEDSQRGRLPQDLAKQCVLQLGARGELAQVFDLAQRYGTNLLGQTGFTALYVQGLMAYQDARSAHGSEAPTLDAALTARYSEAANRLLAALNESDASQYAAAAASCRRMIAWCHYFQCNFLEARKAFELAAESLAPSEAAEALWMAIVSLDKVVETGRDPNLTKELDALTERFVSQFPSSERTATLRLRRVIARMDLSESAAEELLAIPENSEMYLLAQRRAAEIFYQLFRKASAQDRHFLGNRFLFVALPQLSRASRDIEMADEGGIDRFMIRARQVAEVALHESVERADAARAAIEALRDLRDNEGADVTAFADELQCRQMQERLLAHDVDAAAAAAEELWNRDSKSPWARLAARSMFKYGHRVWKTAEASDDEKRLGMELIAKHGGRVLYEYSGSADSLNQTGALAYHIAVAEASFTLWEKYGDPVRGKGALYVYEKLLAAKPRNASFLRATALLSAKFGEPGKAMQCWRAIIAGSSSTSEAWFEAKYFLIQLLMSHDMARASEVMAQHKQLHPDYGPPPWGAMLKSLDLQLQQDKTTGSTRAAEGATP